MVTHPSPSRPFRARNTKAGELADGKHGNYSTREDCDAGGLAGSDTCDQNDRFYRFPVRFPQQNIWSRAIPCFWPRHTFYGWQGLEQVGSTAYSDILAQYAGW